MTTFYPEPCQVPDAHGNPCGSTGQCEHTTPEHTDVWHNAR